MTTKENLLLLLKDKHKNVTDNVQYRNLTLNKNHKVSSDAFPKTSKSVITERRKFLDYGLAKQMRRTVAPTKLSDFANEKDSQTKKEFHSWNKSTKDLSPCFNNNGSGKEENGLKKGKNLNASTLSLYIEAYENSNEANLFEKEGLKKNALIIKRLNAKQIYFNSTLVIQNAFEFPRQQENGEAVNPEIVQYRASQHLYNLNLQTHQAHAQQPLPPHQVGPSTEIMAEEEVSALAMEEESNPAEVIESETPPPNEPMSSMEEEENNENKNINDENEDTNNFAEDSNAAPDAVDEDGEKLDFGDSSDSDEDEVVVTIGDIKTNLPLPRRGFPVQKLDPNVTPNVQGKNIFDVNPSEFDDRPWLKSGANIADYFNFGFNEETWNEYAEKQRLLRLEYPSQAEVNRVIMDELRDKHGNKDAGVPIVMPVHNSGGRNLVTIQSVDTKPPVKIGFPTQNNISINTSAAENLPPMIRHLVTGGTSTPQPQQQQQTVQIPTVNLTTPVVGALPTTPTKPIVVDLTRPPPNFNPNIPPPNFNTSKPATDSSAIDIKPELPPGVIPTTTASSLGFNPNVPPPNFPIRLPATNLTNLSRPMNPMSFNRPPMGNYYNQIGGMIGAPMNLNGPPPTMLRQHSNDGPPGISNSASRSSMDGPPGTEVEMYRSDRRDRERDRRRDSDGSDDDRRRRRHERGDRERDRDSRDTRTRRRSRSPRERSSRHDRDRSERDRGDRDERSKRRTSRDRDERSSRRYKEEEREASASSSSRRHRRDKDESKTKSSSSAAVADLDDRPPGV